MANIVKEGKYRTVVDGGIGYYPRVKNSIRWQTYSSYNQYRWERILCNGRIHITTCIVKQPFSVVRPGLGLADCR